jgi:hypothetical protein
MVLHLVGLGLGDEQDVTLKGMEAIKGSAHVFLEAYTSVLGGELAVEKLEAFYGCKVTVADREMVEERYAPARLACRPAPARRLTVAAGCPCSAVWTRSSSWPPMPTSRSSSLAMRSARRRTRT